jgi:hypothetical protein
MATFCPFCGSPSSEGWVYCSGCGKTLPVSGNPPQTPPLTLETQSGVSPEPRPAPTALSSSDQIPVQPSQLPASDISSRTIPIRPWSVGPAPWSRFWARMIDNNLWALVFALLLKAVGIRIGEMEGAGLGFLVCSSWVPVEATLLAWVGTTPGKWLFNIRLLSLDGKPLGFGLAFQRARRVWIYGLGLGLLVFPLITVIYSYFELKKRGASTWDTRGGIQSQHRQLNGARKLILTFLLCALFLLLSLVAIYWAASQG